MGPYPLRRTFCLRRKGRCLLSRCRSLESMPGSLPSRTS
ncbi:MAG TPA: hypothetical protein ENG31_00735 [Candidatus Thorarchaeota archaeon]|nr:MAG: hypothetical protein DRO73_05190 [Candidatus Thorarchaeota archaeon]RLI61026.1 MAG: hypothetical protein DRO93_05460 [Candidatus Thorarchaeota archaeon]HDD67132.1 hypothetical protein [Candidatus Thorarchaeota archaeon]